MIRCAGVEPWEDLRERRSNKARVLEAGKRLVSWTERRSVWLGQGWVGQPDRGWIVKSNTNHGKSLVLF